MIYLKDLLLLTEGWKTYRLSSNPKVLLYDFYVLSYLTTLPLNQTQKGFSGNLIGRDPNDVVHDIAYAQSILLPVLLKQMKNSLFFAICAEIRHVFDREQDFSLFKNHRLLKHYCRYYKQMVGPTIPDEFHLRRKVRNPQVIPGSFHYNDSYKAAMLAIKKTGTSTVAFAELAARLFTECDWDHYYGGKKWAEIADGYIMLCKATTNSEKQVAIDHAYDLEHNSGTALNKVGDFAINNSYEWIKLALDHKRDAKSMYDLLPHCSSDMRKLALEAFKIANVKKPDPLENEEPTLKNFIIGDKVSVNKGKLEGIVVAKNGLTYKMEITKNRMSAQENGGLYPIGSVLQLYPNFMTLITPAKFKIGDKVMFTGALCSYEANVVKIEYPDVIIQITKAVKAHPDPNNPFTEHQVGSFVNISNNSIGWKVIPNSQNTNVDNNKNIKFKEGDLVTFQIPKSSNSTEMDTYHGIILTYTSGQGPDTEWEVEITKKNRSGTLELGDVIFVKNSILQHSDLLNKPHVFTVGQSIKIKTKSGYLLGTITGIKTNTNGLAKNNEYVVSVTDASHDSSGVYYVGCVVFTSKKTMELMDMNSPTVPDQSTPVPIKEAPQYPLTKHKSINFPLMVNSGYLYNGNRCILENIDDSGDIVSIKDIATGKQFHVPTSKLAYDYSINKAFDGNGNLIDSNKIYLYKTSKHAQLGDNYAVNPIDEMATLITSEYGGKITCSVVKSYNPHPLHSDGEKLHIYAWDLLPIATTKFNLSK